MNIREQQERTLNHRSEAHNREGAYLPMASKFPGRTGSIQERMRHALMRNLTQERQNSVDTDNTNRYGTIPSTSFSGPG
jgi:hypothetical protein